MGKKAKWFSYIENTLLQNPGKREIKEIYRTVGSNTFASIILFTSILTDKRKKEWVLIDKENNELELRKIVKKSKHKILMELWLTKENNLLPGYVEIEKAKNLLISKQNEEYSWYSQNKVLTTVPKPLLKNNQKYTLRYKDIIPNSASRFNISRSSKEERLFDSL